MQTVRNLLLSSFVLASLAGTAAADDAIRLKTMGSFFFGGTVTTQADGSTFHGEHGYAQYYIPEKAKNLPVILWHGIGQSGKSFETTPDGREGFQALLPRDGWAAYIIDQPRRGRAGRSTTMNEAVAAASSPTLASEAGVFSAFRLGTWLPPKPAVLHPGLKMPSDGYTMDQFMRQQTPDTGARPHTDAHRRFMGQTVGKLLERTGPAILVTHSASGQYGWYTAMMSPERVKAIVAFEPGHHVFPENEIPGAEVSPVAAVNTAIAQQPVPMKDFLALTKIPILMIYGDNIARKPGTIFNDEVWRISFQNARKMADAVNRHGGNARVLSLPEAGIRGNTHAAFADTNNKEILELVEKWLNEQKLDGTDHPHTGPVKTTMPLTVPLAGITQ